MAAATEAILREAYDAFAKQDAERLFGCFTGDVRFQVPGKWTLARIDHAGSADEDMEPVAARARSVAAKALQKQPATDEDDDDSDPASAEEAPPRGGR